MTERDIQGAIMRDRWQQNFCLPNYTPNKWWECDVFELTGSNYIREYEVKLTRGDFFADAKKERSVYLKWEAREELERQQQRARVDGTPIPPYPTENKHELLAAGDPRGPVQFWYCVPVGLITLEEVPAWAGLFEVREASQRDPHWQFSLFPRKKAPRLHKSKASPGVVESARAMTYWRMHNALGTRRGYWDEHDLSDGAGI